MKIYFVAILLLVVLAAAVEEPRPKLMEKIRSGMGRKLKDVPRLSKHLMSSAMDRVKGDREGHPKHHGKKMILKLRAFALEHPEMSDVDVVDAFCSERKEYPKFQKRCEKCLKPKATELMPLVRDESSTREQFHEILKDCHHHPKSRMSKVLRALRS
ncbi:hypothetical protein GEMRC1_002438 [Eukaryota sp. GEM-RC1]